MTEQLLPVEHDPDTGTYWLEFDPSETSPITGVVSVFDAIEKSEPIDLPPLYDVIECDALDRLAVGHRRTAWTNTLEIKCVTDRIRLRVESSGASMLVEVRHRAA